MLYVIVIVYLKVYMKEC